MSILVYGNGFNPWKNLAVEKHLFLLGKKEVILYLWQNANTVVIGRNQNAYKECDLSAMEADGVTLARRESGGGAVFHDTGNLNFTFIAPNNIYDIPRQMTVIQKAVAQFGIQVRLTGRNDIVAGPNGCKFSGNAFQKGAAHSLHHGTLLISADLGKASKYLTPSKSKLRSKGVKSVRSRICNLSEWSSAVTVEEMCRALVRVFESEYGAAQLYRVPENDPRTAQFCAEFSDPHWLLGKASDYAVSYETRFDWGSIELRLAISGNAIAGVQIFSDAMDEKLVPAVESALIGGQYEVEEMAQRVRSIEKAEAGQIAGWILSSFSDTDAG